VRVGVESSLGSLSPLRNPAGELRSLGRVPAAAIALVYAVILASLPLMAFRDRENYLEYATYPLDLLDRYLALSPLAALVNEPVWLLINAALGVLLSPQNVMRQVIFLSAFTVAYLGLRAARSNWPWLLLFLLLPQVLKNHITHLRQGAAIAIFLMGWFSPVRLRRVILMGLAPFVHASFFFVLALHVLTQVLLRLRLAADIRGLVYISFAAGVGIGLSTIASLLGARQAQEYEFAAAEISGAGFVFWTLMVALFLFQGKKIIRDHALAVAATLFYLGTYFFVEVTARIFESVLLLVLLAGLNLTRWRRWAFLGGMVLWEGLQWYLRATRPGTVF
jgi:hypothetical protein